MKLVDDDSSRITEASAVCQLADGARLCFTSDQGNLTVNGNMRRALAQALPGCARFAEGQTVFAYDQHYTFDVQGL